MPRRRTPSYDYIPDTVKQSLRDIYRITHNIDESPSGFSDEEVRQLMPIIRKLALDALVRINIGHEDAISMSKIAHSLKRDDRVWEPRQARNDG